MYITPGNESDKDLFIFDFNRDPVLPLVFMLYGFTA